MTTFDLVSTWVQLSPAERRSVRQAYFPPTRIGGPVPDMAEMSRPLSSALRRIALALQDSWASTAPSETVSFRRSLDGTPAAPVAACTPADAHRFPVDAHWRWDTARDAMTWAPGLFALYGYPAGAVEPTIWRHLEHKDPADRARVEAMVLAGVTDAGPVSVTQTVVTTAGERRRVTMRVQREPGDREVITGVVVDATAA